MKRYHFYIETVLITITLSIVIATLLNDEMGFLFPQWWTVLGISQVIHALVLRQNYYNEWKIRQYITRYCLGVFYNFLFLGLGMTAAPFIDPGGNASDIVLLITLLIFPAILALYLWYITWKNRRKSEV
ncbi:MAG TPA: hypothetical protein VHM26_02345 [Chitinophagaceae bacterium]|jgi:hypothetical protein|nr:hypothetical protein [Chitinophagaceae bacterium]